MSETFDTVTTNPGSGGARLCGAVVAQSGVAEFLPACYLVFGGHGGPYTVATTGSGLPVAQDGSWSVSVSNFPGTQAISGTVTVNQGTAGSSAWKVDGSGVTQPVSGTFWQAIQPVSGTVTANVGTTNGLALDTSVNGVLVAQGSTTSGEKGPLVQAAVTTAAPSYTTAQTSPLSLTTGGALRVDASAATVPVSGTFWQTTQPVSGSVSVSGSVAVTGTFWQSTQPISAASLPLPAGAATSAKQPALGTAGSASSDVLTVQGIASMTALKVDGSAVTQPVSGTFWPTTQPVSGTVTANVGTTNGLALDTSVNGLLLAQGSTTSGAKGPLVQGAVTTAAPSYTTAQTSPLSLTMGGALRVDASAATVPVSAAALPLPSGAATAAKQPALGTAGTASSDVLSVQGIASMTALKVDGSAVTQPVSGTFWQATQPVSISGNQAVNVSQVAGTTADTNSGTKSAGTLRVVLATDQPALTNALKVDGSGVIQPVSGTVTANQGGSNWSVNVAQVAGSTITTAAAGIPMVGLADGAGNAINRGQQTMAHSLPVVVASDQGAVPQNLTQWGSTTVTSAVTLADATSPPTAPLVGAFNLLYNGSTYDQQRGGVSGTALVSAARTAQTSSGPLTNYNGRGVLAFLNITAASGTGGLSVAILSTDPVSGGSVNLNQSSLVSLKATGGYVFELGPGASSSPPGGASFVSQRTAGQLPRSFALTVTVGDSSSYTYSLGYYLIP